MKEYQFTYKRTGPQKWQVSTYAQLHLHEQQAGAVVQMELRIYLPASPHSSQKG